ncbi:hypothetical protein [Actinoplanes sp. NPDC049265]
MQPPQAATVLSQVLPPLAIGLRCRLAEGDARVNDDESTSV